MFDFSTVVILHGLKYLKWSDFFFLIASGSRDLDIFEKVFSSKHKNLGTIGKTILFWSTFNKERRVNSYVSTRYRVSKVVKQGGKNRKIKFIRLHLANYYCVSWIFCNKNVFSLVFWKAFFRWTIFFNFRFKKPVIYL